MPESRLFDTTQTNTRSEAEKVRRDWEENSRYRWNLIVNKTVPSTEFAVPGGGGGGFDSQVYHFMGFMPEGEIREMIVGFERKPSNGLTQDLTYGPQDVLDISLIYRARGLDWLVDNVSAEKETILARISVSDDPLRFMDEHTYFLNPSDSREEEAEISANPAHVPEYLRAIWLKLRLNTDNSSATNYILKNVNTIYVTVVLGSAPSAEQYFGIDRNQQQMILSGPQPFTPYSPLGNL